MDWSTLSGGVLSACLGTFGQTISYEAIAEAPVTVPAVLGSTMQQETAAPGRYARVYVRLADFPAYPKRGAKVTAGGTVYNLVEIEADGNGGAYFTLHDGSVRG